jgi:hypothetical protein
MNAKLFQIIPEGKTFRIEEGPFSREDLKFLLWLLSLAKRESEFMNRLERRYYQKHFLRVLTKLESLAIDAK